MKDQSALPDTDPRTKWQNLSEAFPERHPLAEVEPVAGDSLPEPYRSLLIHDDHMTRVMERFHGSLVDVRVLARRIDGPVYSRQIVLSRQDNGAVVQFAFAQFDLNAVSDVVREEILGEQIPLGRVLVNNKVTCTIELKAPLKVRLDQGLSDLFGMPSGQVTYGRIARILCDGRPGFDVIEVSAPIGLQSQPAR